MSETQVGSLSIDLALDIANYQKSLRQATADLDKTSKQWSTHFGAMKDGVNGIFGPMAALKGLVVGLAVSGFALLVKGALDMAGTLQDVSAASGQTIEDIQELRFAFGQAGISFEETDKALEIFARNVGDLRQESGGLYTALKANNPELATMLATSQDMGKALDAAVEALANQTDEAKRASLANDLFGKSGVKLNAALAEGIEKFRTQRQVAREMGIVLSTEMVQAADDAGDKLQLLGRILDVQLKRSILALTPLIVNVTEWLTKLAVRTGERLFPDTGKELAELEAGLGLLTQRLAGLNAEREKHEARKANGGLFDRVQADMAIKSIDAETVEIQEQIGVLLPLIAAGREVVDGKKKETKARQDNTGAISKEKYELQGYKELVDAIDAQLAAEDREWDRAKEIRADLRSEQDKLNDSIEELNRLLDTGKISRDEYNAALDKMRVGLRETEKAAADTGVTARDLGMVFTSAFEDAIVEGKNVQAILQGIYKDLLRLFIRKAVTEPVLAALTSGLGGGSAGSTIGSGGVGSGSIGQVGQSTGGPGHLAPSGGGGNTIVINAPGADGNTVARLESFARRNQTTVVAQAVQAQRDYVQRGGR